MSAMDTPRPNPTINPPPLTVVHHRRLHSRSPSLSPMRQPNPRDCDPLLRDLSPTATLRTFQTAETDSSPAFSFRGAASVSERAWGAKAAQTCLDLRSWVRELEGWQWPGSFSVPEKEPNEDEDGKGGEGGGGGEKTEDYWGSLPASIVVAYERRADDIAQQLDDIDVEELKDFVLSAHRQAGSGRASRDDSIASIGATTDLRRLDDFTALITATILQALPYLSRLHRLLDVWTVRLTVSRNAPSYLPDLRQVQTDLEYGWAAIAVSPSTTARPRDSGANFTRGTLIEMKSMIQYQVTSLGRRLDAFLDQLEGREETVPDAWIDDFERLEKAYGDWVVQAERKAFENEWRAGREREMREAERTTTARLLAGDQLAKNASHSYDFEDHEREAERTTTARLLAGDQLAKNASNSYDFEDHERDADSVAEPSSRPSSGLFALPTNGSERSSILRQSSVPLDGLAREESETLPHKHHSRHLSQSKTLTNDSTASNEMKKNDSPSKRARHMPIIIDFDRDGHKLALMDDNVQSKDPGPTSSTEGLTALPVPPLPPQEPSSISREPSDASKSSGAVKKRAAFLESAGIERKEALNRSVKSPVRPFEHASNAFTRLFQKREKAPEPAESLKGPRARRSMSGKSRSGSIKKQGGDNDQVIWGGRGTGSVTPKSTTKTDRISSGPVPSTGKSDIGSEEKREARSRSSSFRRLSFGRNSSRPPAAEPFHQNGSPPTHRDHADLPGGFRTRSTSENSLPRARSRTSQTERPGEVRRLRSQHRGELARPPVETYQPKRLSSPFRHVSDEHKEPDYPVDWPLASPPDTERNSPVKEQQDELILDDSDNIQPALAHQQRQRDQDDTDDDTAGPEIQFSRAPLETDAFDRMFVSSLPASPDLERPQVRKSSQEDSRGTAMGEPATIFAKRANPIPTLNDAMLGDHHEEFSKEDLAIGSAGMPGLAADESETPMGFDRRAPLEDGSVLTKGEFEAEEADRRSSISRDVSDGEEGIHDMDYFGAPPSPIARSRASSTGSAADAPNVPELQPRIASPSKSPVPLKLKIPGAEAGETQQEEESPEFRPALLSRASVASIGSYPRASLRSIDVSRRSSLASPVPVSQSPRDSVPVSAIDEGPRYPSGHPLNHDSPLVFPHLSGLQDGGIPPSPVSPLSTNTSPMKTRSGSLPLGASPAERKAEIRDDEESEGESPRSSKDVTPAPLNVAMAKRRAQQQNRTPVASGVSLATTPNVPERHRESTPPSNTGGDKMDRHVSEVLNRLPSSSIKFKARPGAVTPTLLRTSERRDYSGPRPRTAPRVPSRTGLNSTGGGDMTLAPAEPSTTKKNHTPSAGGGASEGEVKLYHLTQAGREDPIKLFVRLVGEGERVMVRVGGGWADLADYLRQYADHHGSRTVSGSGLEMTQSALQQSGRKASSSSLTPTPLSRAPVTPTRETKRPGSRLGVSSTAGGTQQESSNGDYDDAATTFLRPSTAYERTPNTTSNENTTAQQQPPFRSTPQSTSSIKNSSRPSTAGSLHAVTTTSTSSSRPGSSSNRQPIGNRNPKAAVSAESLLPEQKAKWVEEMLEQARAGATGGSGGAGGSYSNGHGVEQEGEKKGVSDHGSGGNSGGVNGGGYFGELGTAGATRRVVFRPSHHHHHQAGGGCVKK